MMFPMPRIGAADGRAQAKPALRDCLEAVLQQSDQLIGSVIDGLNSAKPQPLASSKGHAKSNVSATIAGSSQAQTHAVEYLKSNLQAVKITFASELRGAQGYN